jgi:hypothetical protein
VAIKDAADMGAKRCARGFMAHPYKQRLPKGAGFGAVRQFSDLFEGLSLFGTDLQLVAF